jgi:hypothetical protein
MIRCGEGDSLMTVSEDSGNGLESVRKGAIEDEIVGNGPEAKREEEEMAIKPPLRRTKFWMHGPDPRTGAQQFRNVPVHISEAQIHTP